jgi:hypothetical protein
VTDLFSWIVTLLVAVLVVTFAVALLSMRRVPLGARPRTRSYDRMGRFIGWSENPDFHENPGEDSAEEADIEPPGGAALD